MQRKCLRLVYAHMSSKEIAPQLGVEPGTVDQYLKAAMRVLGVSDRRAAARMLAAQEGLAAQPLVYQPLDVASRLEPVTFASSTETGQRFRPLGEAMMEEQMAFTATPPLKAQMLPLPMGGARPNDVGMMTRLAWIAGIVIGIALAFGALVAGVEALTRLLQAD
jgi:DNA-binding CsgD family transcriptional regulator